MTGFAFLCTAAHSLADDDAISYKFTPTYYRTTSQSSAYDVNLRASRDTNTWWVGYYRRGGEFQQLRLGYERSIELPRVKLVPSFQYASRGFLGGSLTAEIGEREFGLLGMGRTNLKDYYNLNFDPNDFLMLGAGTHALPATTLTAYHLWDDRLGTGQRISHVVARIKADGERRWTLDVFHKAGRAPEDGEWVRGTGASLTYDFGAYFARLASDPHVNFTHDHMIRFALGMRF